MSELKVTSISHPSASAAGITLGSDGSVVLPSGFTGGIGTNVVQTVKDDTFGTTSTSLVDLTGMTVTITPTTATSRVLLIANIAYSASTTTTGPGFVLTDNADVPVDAPASGTQYDMFPGVHQTYLLGRASIVVLVSPATISAVTYKVRVQSGSGGTTAYVNRDGSGAIFAYSTLTAIEVAA